ncbi:hypothetical protein [Mangrovibacterium lignilyticum]|uniref:hypothetical protein n=1 Tax=Mangrovibacterium lignilyticum TaxID=2668052 RepID=UPI0013D58225|nr:hypothetical protein [Mangrovibacterium lignilyticum]
MKKYYYLVATPESLIVSHLAPGDFGNYLAVGTKKQIRGQAIFFEIDPDKAMVHQDYVDLKMKPYEDGQPKRSVFLSIYRVFEKTPLNALRSLYLVTDDGRVLEIQAHDYIANKTDPIHLYQQLVPNTTRVASKLDPVKFIQFLTDISKPVSAPKVFICDLLLNELVNNPYAPIHNLPYPNPDHLRDCLIKLKESPGRQTKTVLRYMKGDISYRTIKTGFYVGDQKHYLFYPFPSMTDLEGKYYLWWRSALTRHF